jgi:carbonic anhydrase
MKVYLPLLSFSLFLVLNNCRPKTDSYSDITLANDSSNLVLSTAPDAIESIQQGYALPGLDHGLIQSPINILDCQTKDLACHKVVLHYKQSKEKVVNLGHTIQVDYQPESNIEYDDHIYDFKQFHFHTPSEHLIDGITYPMEMHMVHKRRSDDTTAVTDYLVIGIWFKEGGKDNPFLNEFMEAVPDHEGEVIEVRGGYVNVNDLLEQADEIEYYHYNGSLTTPPFSESVTWLIIKHIFVASPDQIEFINRLEGNNARHVQARFEREVDIIH